MTRSVHGGLERAAARSFQVDLYVANCRPAATSLPAAAARACMRWAWWRSSGPARPPHAYRIFESIASRVPVSMVYRLHALAGKETHTRGRKSFIGCAIFKIIGHARRAYVAPRVRDGGPRHADAPPVPPRYSVLPRRPIARFAARGGERTSLYGAPLATGQPAGFPPTAHPTPTPAQLALSSAARVTCNRARIYVRRTRRWQRRRMKLGPRPGHFGIRKTRRRGLERRPRSAYALGEATRCAVRGPKYSVLCGRASAFWGGIHITTALPCFALPCGTSAGDVVPHSTPDMLSSLGAPLLLLFYSIYSFFLISILKPCTIQRCAALLCGCARPPANFPEGGRNNNNEFSLDQFELPQQKLEFLNSHRAPPASRRIPQRACGANPVQYGWRAAIRTCASRSNTLVLLSSDYST